MAQDVMLLEIVTPAGGIFSEQVSYVQVPAALGLMGILPGHAALMTSLDVGPVKYVQDDKEYYLAVSGGFLEVKQNHITLLANEAQKSEDIDLQRAQVAAERARQRLAANDDNVDMARARRALARANNRIKVVELSGRKFQA